jgi:hypothetical protein
MLLILYFMAVCPIYVHNVYCLYFMYNLLFFYVFSGGGNREVFQFHVENTVIWSYACYFQAMVVACCVIS